MFIPLLCLACSKENPHYLNDPALSDALGNPRDSLTLYYPFQIKKDGQTIRTELDSFALTFTIEVLVENIPFVTPDGRIVQQDLPQELDAIKPPGRHSPFSIDTTKELSLEEWNTFEKLLEQCSYWQMKNAEEQYGTDGSTWVLEAHLEKQYWVVERWSPKDRFQKCGMYLIGLSGLRKEQH